jgi:hypothetical protein
MISAAEVIICIQGQRLSVIVTEGDSPTPGQWSLRLRLTTRSQFDHTLSPIRWSCSAARAAASSSFRSGDDGSLVTSTPRTG